MKLTAQLTQWMALLFAVLCGAYGVNGMIASGALAEGAVRDDARGFAWFWLFLAGVGVVLAVVSWLMARGKLGTPEG